jgi:hypothetical protein
MCARRVLCRPSPSVGPCDRDLGWVTPQLTTPLRRTPASWRCGGRSDARISEPFDESSEKPHSRQTYRVDPCSSMVMPICDAAGWADRRAVVVGVCLLPDSHVVSLARERTLDLLVTTSSSGRPRTPLPVVPTVRSVRLCHSGIPGARDWSPNEGRHRGGKRALLRPHPRSRHEPAHRIASALRRRPRTLRVPRTEPQSSLPP